MSFVSARWACVRLSTRADPKNTTVSWTFCALNRFSGSRYSARNRIGRASELSRNAGSWNESRCCFMIWKNCIISTSAGGMDMPVARPADPTVTTDYTDHTDVSG